MQEEINLKKNMKTANIRVSAINNTKTNGVINYSVNSMQLILEKWAKEKQMEYFLIEHREDLDNIHFHIVIKFGNVTRFETIKNKFPYGNIESSKSIKNSVQYLVHMNSPEKHQYKWEDIITNTKELNKYQLKSKVSEELDINYYIEEINKGNIKEFESYDKIPILIYTKYGSRIDKAYKIYYERMSKDIDRKIEVEFMFGGGGTGKTLFAKTDCEIKNLSFCISSSSNDPMQDYRGEDVLILDDLRDSSFKFADLLKILDNNTRSSISSRYRNKCFIGSKIIITSNSDLDNWYNWESYEDKHQLKRRIKTMIKFTHKDITFYEYDNIVKKYEYIMSIDNMFRSMPEIEKGKAIIDKYAYLKGC